MPQNKKPMHCIGFFVGAHFPATEKNFGIQYC
jgi:hypothetical protein